MTDSAKWQRTSRQKRGCDGLFTKQDVYTHKDDKQAMRDLEMRLRKNRLKQAGIEE